MLDKELKPCPFCQSPQLILFRNCEFDYWSISCNNCNGSISKSDHFLPNFSWDDNDVDCDCIEEDAMDYYLEGKIKGLEPLINAWNTRSQDNNLCTVCNSNPCLSTCSKQRFGKDNNALVSLDEEKLFEIISAHNTGNPDRFYNPKAMNEDRELALMICKKFGTKV